MNPYLRSQHVERLIEAIRVIAPGATFERFGGHFLNHYLDVALTHRGLNVLGNPVGGAVDSVDESGRHAAEYSIDKTYFDGSMIKATNGALHVVELHPQALHIYLLSSQRAPTGRIETLKQTLGETAEFAQCQLHVFDSRRIAEVIVDELLISDAAVEELAEQLQVLKSIRDEHAANRLVLQANYWRVDRPDVSAEIARQLALSACLVIWGLAGAGKSDVAAAFAVQHAEDYELTIWLEGDVVRRIEDLQSTPVVRGGESRNVLHLLRTRRCLLIIDDARGELPRTDLTNACRAGSHVIVTQRHKQCDGYELPLLPKSEANALLNHGLKQRCPDGLWEMIWETIGGHTLSLGLMNSAASEGASWEDISADCAAVGEFSAGGQRLADRLLERFKPSLDRELSVFSWAGDAACDHGFLRSVIQPVGIRKLKDHGLTAADLRTVVRIHDVVFASLTTAGPPSEARVAELNDGLDSYIAQVWTQTGFAFSSVAKSFKGKIQELARAGDARPTYRLALAHAWGPGEIDPGLLGDPETEVNKLAAAGTAAAPVLVSSIIETIEVLYRADGVGRGKQVARDNLRCRLPIFEVHAKLPGLSDRQAAEINTTKRKRLILLRHVEAQ